MAKQDDSGPESMTAEDAEAALASMNLDERIQTIRLDIESSRRRFASIDVFRLAELVDVPQPEHPVGWVFVTSTVIRTFDDYLEDGTVTDGAGLAFEMEGLVEDDRLNEIRGLCDDYDRGRRSDLTFLEDNEREEITTKLAKRELEDLVGNGMGCVAYYQAGSGDSGIWFHGTIEDDGSCISLKGPYEGVDGPVPEESDPAFVCEIW